MQTATVKAHVATIPCTFTDKVNRVAIATGSVSNAIAGSRASYNGHRVTVRWNDYKNFYQTYYYFGEFVYLCRSKDLAESLRAAFQEYDRGAKGASIVVEAKPADLDDVLASGEFPRLVAGVEPTIKTSESWKDIHIEDAIKKGTVHDLEIARTEKEYYIVSAARRYGLRNTVHKNNVNVVFVRPYTKRASSEIGVYVNHGPRSVFTIMAADKARAYYKRLVKNADFRAG